MAEISLSEVDVEAVLFRLTRYAQHLFAAPRLLGMEPVDVVYPGGEGPEDLAMNLLLRFLDPQDKTVRWRGSSAPSTEALLALLKKALWHDFLDLKKSKRYKTTVYTDLTKTADGGQDLTLKELASYLDTPEGEFLRKERVRLLVEEFADDPKAQEIVRLQLDPEGYNQFTNQELAKLLDTDVPEIENRKKRVMNRLLRIQKRQVEEEGTHA